MARPTKIDYSKVVADYKTGQYTPQELARKYGIKRTTLISHLERNNIQVCDNLRQAVNTLDKGLELLRVEKEHAVSDKISDKEKEDSQKAIESGLEYLERKHGVLARIAVNIVGKAMSKTDQLMSNCADGEEFKNIMQGFKTAVDTIGLFPKQPLQQINIQNQNANIQSDTQSSLGEQQVSKISFELKPYTEKTVQDEILGEVLEEDEA